MIRAKELVIIFLGCSAASAWSAQQCFTTTNTYGAVGVTVSAGCGNIGNPYTYNTRTGFAFKNASCTLTFNHPITTSSITVKIDGTNADEQVAVSTSAGAYSVVSGDLSGNLTPGSIPNTLSAVGGSIKLVSGSGSGTFSFTNSPPASITSLTLTHSEPGIGSGSFFQVCADDATAAAQTTTFIPPIASVPYVKGTELPTALDMGAGNGPAVNTCLLPALQQVFGGSFVYQGQAASGQSAFNWNGKTISYFPLSATSTSGQTPSLQLQSNNPLAVVTSCGTLWTAPAPSNLELFGSAVNSLGLWARIDQNGVIAINQNGTVLVLRPDYFVTSGSSSALGLTKGSDGVYRFADGAGNSQIMYPAFLDPQALAAAAGGSILIQSDGTAIQNIGGQRWLLVPDQTLANVPADHSVDYSVWQDGPNHFGYRILNVKPFPQNLFQPTYMQGYTRSPAP